MKKLLVLLLCLSGAMLFAQTDDLHYVIDETGVQPTQLTIYCTITIDGVEEYNGEDQADGLGQYLELAAFDQDNICRAAKMPVWYNTGKRWIYVMKLRGDTGFTYPVWKIWNHQSDSEMDLDLDMEEIYTFAAGVRYGSNKNPELINFTHQGGGETFTIHINGYSELADPTGGYVLLSSPIEENVDALGAGLINTNPVEFDLFRFNQAGTEGEWENWKLEGEHYHFNLESSRGYLYACENGTDFTVTGTPYTGDGLIPLDYEEGATFKGFNLIGNPFPGEASIDMPYYVLDETGKYFQSKTEKDDNIGLMCGVLVKATEPGQSATFIPANGKRSGNAPTVNIVLSNNGKGLDNAVIRFDEGATLGKFQKNGSTRVYFPMNDEEYAIANATNEMPLNFEAETAGTYTLSFKLKANVGYLHMFDKLTGEDVNLLTTPEYSFVASPRDAQDRFIVRLSETSANGTFIYQNGDELIVSGNGTLQVFDIMGRFVGSYEVNGIERISAAQFSNNVYVFRMIGETVNTQKIVVR